MMNGNRIENNGGRVAWYKDAKGNNVGPPRVWLKTGSVPGLAMSRSLGDLVATYAGVIHKPEIKHYQIGPNDKAIVLATDGVWEFLSNRLVTKLWIESIKNCDPEAAWK